MKLLTVSALLCAVMALSTAADEGSSDGGKRSTQPGKVNVEKRTLCYWHRWVGWTRYGNRYYHYFPYHRTWAQAQRFCESRNANLASVRNLGEYRAIQRVIYRATHRYGLTWIGGSDAQQERYWFWIDGTPFRFAYWCRGEPNNRWGREHCLHMNWTGYKCMNDISCHYRYPFVCVWKRR
ncbi:ladderlectin-like [Archocentrus centrarchus]|uniref:ladderlectin-like n=1 Tax=Archocentrus centrarchus TaxID=63155 RepID=UPI0011EA09C6|nr:ladderlectin-like [Archocentrus centrarchus]